MLKIIIILFSFTILLASCMEGTRDSRTTYKSQRNPIDIDKGHVTTGDPASPTGTATPEPYASPPSGEDSTNIPTEIADCGFSTDGISNFKENHSHFGKYTLCQKDETDIYVQVASPVTGSQLCMFPTYHNGTKSIHIGEPRCFRAENNKIIYKVALIKNRAGYEDFNVTGVMIMKDKAYFYPPPFYQWILSPDAYLFCMQRYNTYGDPSFCMAFKQLGQYVDYRF